jgi:hypothetical protein
MYEKEKQLKKNLLTGAHRLDIFIIWQHFVAFLHHKSYIFTSFSCHKFYFSYFIFVFSYHNLDWS